MSQCVASTWVSLAEVDDIPMRSYSKAVGLDHIRVILIGHDNPRLRGRWRH